MRAQAATVNAPPSTTASSAARTPRNEARPQEQWPEEELQRDGDADGGCKRPERRPEPPEHGDEERKTGGDVRGVDRVPRGRPDEHGRVAPPVANGAEEGERAEDRRERSEACEPAATSTGSQ